MVLKSDQTKKGKKATADRVAGFCTAHDQYMEYQKPVLNFLPKDCLADLLHADDINIPQRGCKFSFHDPALFAERPDLPHALTAYYNFIHCPFNLLGDKSWWHGAVWRYDFVDGANKKSPGLDINILACCLIAFGEAPGRAVPAPAHRCIHDDLGDDLGGGSGGSSGGDGAAGATSLKESKLMRIITFLFGKHAQKVQAQLPLLPSGIVSVILAPGSYLLLSVIPYVYNPHRCAPSSSSGLPTPTP
jgi:hypothetical protein